MASAAAATTPTKWNTSVIHIEAKETGTFNSGKGIDVPKVYVLDQDGRITYESTPGRKQSSQAIVEALKHSTPVASKDQQALADLLKAHPHDSAQKPATTLVTLEFGDSVGRCVACDIFYPVLQADISATALPPFTWLHVKLETNGYRE